MARAMCVLVLITALLAVCGGQLRVTAHPNGAAELPIADVKQFFQDVVTLSSNLSIRIQGINVINLLSRVPEVRGDLENITSKINDFNGMFATQEVAPFEDADARQVVESLDTFESVQYEMLMTLLNKYEVIALIPTNVQTIHDGLLSLDKSVDILAVNVVNVIPTQKPVAEARFYSLSLVLSLAISTYEPTASLASTAVSPTYVKED